MVSLARLQPLDPLPRLAPCRVALRFVDSTGATLSNVNGQPVQSTVSLAPGLANTLDVPAPTTALGPAGRYAVRPVVELLTQCPFQASGEGFTPATGATKFAIPQLPLYSPGPTAPVNTTGFVNLAAGQTAWLTVFNAKANPTDPCRLRLPHVNAQGQTLSSLPIFSVKVG